MAKPAPFETHVRKAAKAADAYALQSALADLMLVKAHNKAAVVRSIRALKPVAPPSGTPSAMTAYTPAPTRRRGSVRRLGKYQKYEATTLPDVSRYGTFRRYMISTIRAHGDTHSANLAHEDCDNPKFAKNRLDFNWAADNGYIRFI